MSSKYKPKGKRLLRRNRLTKAERTERARIARRREVQKRYYHSHKQLSDSFTERQNEYKTFSTTGKKLCRGCGNRLPPERFYNDPRAADKLTSECIECRSERALFNYYKRKEGK